MTEEKTIPPGYWENANGALIPVSKIKEIDKERHRVVSQLCDEAEKQSATLLAFKTTAMHEVQQFIDHSLAEYDVRAGGKKGNVTLVSFDGRFKIVRQMQESLAFDERLQAAKALIDECIHSWSKGSNANIKMMVNHAFQVDQEGQVSTGRVLGLRSLKITDEKWLEAMRAIADSMRVVSSKPYIRFYKRDDATGAYYAINLDVAAV